MDFEIFRVLICKEKWLIWSYMYICIYIYIFTEFCRHILYNLYMARLRCSTKGLTGVGPGRPSRPGPRCSAPFTWRSSCPVGSVMCRTSDSLGSRRRRRSDGHLVKILGPFCQKAAIARTCQNHALLMAWLCCDTVSYSYWLCLIIVIDCSMLEQEALLLLPHRSFFHEVVIWWGPEMSWISGLDVLKCHVYDIYYGEEQGL